MTFRIENRSDRLRSALAIATLLVANQAGAQAALQRFESGAVQASADVSVVFDQQFSVIRDGYECTCVEHYQNGVQAYVSSCDALECPDVSLLIDCREDPGGPGCDDYLSSCECDCTALEATVEFDHGSSDDVFLTGVPDLWQFDFMCGQGNAANAVGCGPVVGAELFYYWAQQGYSNLVDDFLVGGGNDPVTQVHDWQALVRELRADYMDGGICVPFGGGQYATLMGRMTTALEEYIEDAGYDADVSHYKVCDDCNANAADELTGSEGLALIKEELKAGRPLIMGFNSGRAFGSFIPVPNDDLVPETVYIGELSNGTPAAGTIDHYAVITGFRKLGGLDVLTMNLGWDDGNGDMNVMWNPAGKWAHLYTVDIDGVTDADWCAIDRGITVSGADLDMVVSAFSPSNVEVSHPYLAFSSSTQDFDVLAGQSCGLVREGETISHRSTTHQEEHCADPGDLPTSTDLPTHGFEDTTTRDETNLDYDNGPPILDELQPNP
jgi:hypothetical protein